MYHQKSNRANELKHWRVRNGAKRENATPLER